MPTRVQRRLTLVGVWLAVFGFTFVLMLQRLVVIRDEAWMLWLATRLARGDVLYRQAYDVTTPVAAWLAAGVVRVAGPELAAIRGIVAAVFATEVVLGLLIVRRCGMRTLGQTVLVLALLALGAPFAWFVNLYSALAIMFGVMTLWATLWWLDARRADGEAPWPACLIGVAGALAFWTKPNVGALMALAVGVTLAAAGWRASLRPLLRDVARMAAGAVAVSGAVIAAIVGAHSWAPFVDQVFRSKGDYMDVGFGYLPALRWRAEQLFGDGHPFQLRRISSLLVQAAPVLLLGGLAWGVVRARRAFRAHVVALAAFAVAGTLAVLPRPGRNHITGVLPLVLTAVVATFALGTTKGAPSRVGRVAVLAAGIAAIVGIVAVAVPLYAPERAERVARATTHFEGVPVARRQLQASARLRDQLRALGIETVFIVRKDAGFLYLRTGTRNPLPYDIPERSDLGGADEQGVIRRIAAGHAQWVCVRKPGSGSRSDANLVPRRLETWIRRNLERVAELARCELFRSPVVRTSARAGADHAVGTGANRPARTAAETAS